MTKMLPEPLLSAFQNNGAHLRSVFVVGSDIYDTTASAARDLSNALSLEIVRIPLSVDEYVIDTYIHTYNADTTLFYFVGIEGRSQQLLSRFFRLYSASTFYLVAGVSDNEASSLKRYANYGDVILNTGVQLPQHWTAEVNSAALKLIQSFAVERSVAVALRAGVSARETAEYIVFPHFLLRNDITSADHDQTHTKEKTESLAQYTIETEKVYDAIHASFNVKKKRELIGSKSVSTASFTRSHRTSSMYSKRGRIQRSRASRSKYGSFSLYHSIIAAAPYQQLRRKVSDRQLAYYITSNDIRRYRFLKMPISLHILILDSSGSMSAANRIRYAKGIVSSLAQKAYHDREYMALIVARGDQPKLIAQPTRSHKTLQEKLRVIPTGGKSPLYDALTEAGDVINEFRKKYYGASFRISVLTDGKDNVREYDSDVSRLVDTLSRVTTSIRVISTDRLDQARLFAARIGAEYLPIHRQAHR